jgi:hypothetical protein
LRDSEPQIFADRVRCATVEGEGLFEDTARLTGFSLFHQHDAEVVQRRHEGRIEVERAAQDLLGLAQPTKPQVGPSSAAAAR